MVKIMVLVLFSCIAIFLCHKLCLWLEYKGWMYYRHKKASSGVIGDTLQELNAILQPSARHIIEAKQNKIQSKRNSDNTKS